MFVLRNVRDDELAQWLRSFGCDDTTIGRIQEEEYTKQDLLDFVTREDLMRLNLRYVMLYSKQWWC